tara:strand:+ start:227 stop:607 length:381 start_codon:yes stop_codon:yes gene_type:complete
LSLNKIAIFLACLSLASCASNDFPEKSDVAVIDTRGVDMDVYRADFLDCSSFSKNIDITGRTIEEAALGLGAGAAVGAIIGGKESAKKIGGTAGVLSAVEANVEARYEQSKIIKNCLRGRGYKVLN